MLKAADVKGLIENKKELQNAQLTISTFKYFEGINDTIDKIGSKTLKIKREETAKIIRMTLSSLVMPLNESLELADSLNKNLGDLLVAE